ncbi:hypothetical protein RND71_042172 [Anisodus tanguticus]|uniref:Uncharacterized protein n=1 Tax=Anisodus tanguticus TaxID=243964 RepID=A0AAE1QQ45_9SOLA|nr:hypothetical protein RND71_042172 [Anisodus tanguticus]
MNHCILTQQYTSHYTSNQIQMANSLMVNLNSLPFISRTHLQYLHSTLSP